MNISSYCFFFVAVAVHNDSEFSKNVIVIGSYLFSDVNKQQSRTKTTTKKKNEN